MNNERANRSKPLLALEMAFVGLLAWVIFSSLIAWQSTTVQAGGGDQIGVVAQKKKEKKRFVPPEGPTPPASNRFAALGTANACQGFDFQTGNQGFTVVADFGTGVATPLWHLANAVCRAFLAGHSTPFTFYYGQDATCNYNTGVRNAASLISPPISLTTTFPPYSLGFNYLLFVESSSSFDTTFVDVSTNNGATWTPVLSKANFINDNQWHNVAKDITSVVGAATSIRLRYRFDSVDNLVNSSTGWHVDDVLVCGQAFDYCVQDDVTNDYIQFNSATGVFVTKQCLGGASAQGVGTVTTNGNTVTIQSTTFGNFSTASVDKVAHTGSAKIRFQSGKNIVAYNIVDSNTLNNTCSCP